MGLQIGYADLLEPTGIARTDRDALAYIRLAVRFAAAEAGIAAYDGAFAAVKDTEGYRAECIAAKHHGFAGKSCIHPSQIATANEVFMPDASEIAWARKVVAAAVDADASGVGAYLVDGHMIDKPFVERARAVVALADRHKMEHDIMDRDRSKLHARDYQPDARGTLDGVRILDMSRLFAGNVLTQILGDFGAEVIKIEPPEGDTLRAWKTEGVDTHWKVYARNKKSLCLSLREPRAVEIIRKLVPSAQIFIESFRPGVLEKMGLSPETLLAINPSLVIIRISGWGQDGPYAQRPGFGTVIEGVSGFAAINGFPDREPVLPPMYLADGVAGIYGASAAMIALREVEMKGGRGQVIDLPLLDPLFAILSPQAANYRLTGKVRPRTGSRSTNSAPRNAYRCSDGHYVSLSGSIQKMAERLFRAIGRPDLVDDPRFRTNADRLRHAEELDAIIGEFIGAADASGKCQLLRGSRSHDRSDLRHAADHGGSACHRARADIGLS